MDTLYRHLTENPVDTEHWKLATSSGSVEPLYVHVGDGEIDATEWEETEPTDEHVLAPSDETAESVPDAPQRSDGQPAPDEAGQPSEPETTQNVPPQQEAQTGLAAAEANPGVGSSPLSTSGLHSGGGAPAQGSPVDAQEDKSLSTDEHVARFANNGSTDFGTSNEADQPEGYTPPEPGPGAPGAPTITSPSTGDTITGSTVVITGEAGNGNLVYLEEGEGQFPVNPATASDGQFRFAINLEPGEHTLAVRQRNAAGDQSDPSDEVTVTVEAAPAVDEIEDPEARFAEYLRQNVVGNARLTWDQYAAFVTEANRWLDHVGK